MQQTPKETINNKNVLSTEELASIFIVFNLISSYSVWLRENTNQKNSEYDHFTRRDFVPVCFCGLSNLVINEAVAPSEIIFFWIFIFDPESGPNL